MRLPRSLRDAAEFEYKTIILKGQLKGRDSFAMALAAIVSVCSRSSVFRKTAPVMEALEIGFRKFDSCHSLIAGAKYDLKKETSALNDALELCRLEAAYTP